MSQRDGYSHPVPCILLVVGSFVPVSHQKEGLYENEAIKLIVKIVKQLVIVLEQIRQRKQGLRARVLPQVGRTLVFWKKAFLADLRVL